MNKSRDFSPAPPAQSAGRIAAAPQPQAALMRPRPPRRKHVSLLAQMAAAKAAAATKASDATKGIGHHPAAPFEAYRGQYWLCRCSVPDRKTTWRRWSVVCCGTCGDDRPSAPAS